MVNQKRVERKLALLITDGPWYSNEFDRNEYRLRKFKRVMPDRYVQRRNNIINELDALKREIDQFIANKHKNGR